MDNFRLQDISIGHIDTRFVKRFYATNGDYNGRGLRIHLSDNGSVVNTTGVNVTLFYKKNSGSTGNVVATLIDASKGVYEVEYPTSMLDEVGTVLCNIKVVDNGKIVHGFNFTVDVMDAFPNAQYSSNEATELQQLIANASALQSQIADLQNELNNKLGIAETAANSNKLDGYDSSAFVFRNNPAMNEHMNMTNHRIYNLANPVNDNHAVNRGYADGRYLGKSAQAKDSAKLDGAIASKDQTGNTVAQRTGDGTLKAKYFSENGEILSAKYLRKIISDSLYDSIKYKELFSSLTGSDNPFSNFENTKDLDDATSPGLYTLDGDTLLHAPASYKYSLLKVYKRRTMIVQTIYTSTNKVYQRVRNFSGVWSGWKGII